MNKKHKAKEGDFIEIEKENYVILKYRKGKNKGYYLKRWKQICKTCGHEI